MSKLEMVQKGNFNLDFAVNVKHLGIQISQFPGHNCG
jgi:hypothetical protein